MNGTADLAKAAEDFSAAMQAMRRLRMLDIPEAPVPLGNGLALVFEMDGGSL